MKSWIILNDGQIVIRHGHDKINDPCIFMDENSARLAKAMYFPNVEYELIKVDIAIKLPD